MIRAPKIVAGGALLLLALILLPGRVAAAPAAAVPDSALASWDGGGLVLWTEFAQAWGNLAPNRRPPGDPIPARLEFLSQIVDRKILAAEMKKSHIELTAAEALEVQRAQDQMAQNALFAELSKGVGEPTSEDLEFHRRRSTTLAEIRFVTFANWDRARIWRQRLATGTPIAALDAAIAHEGAALAQADSFRSVAAEQIPDTLASIIWSMRVGQVSDVLPFASQPTVIVLRKFTPRMSTLSNADNAGLKADWIRLQYRRVRERYRLELVDRLHRTFDEDGMAILMKAHLLLPPRQDVDSTNGMPIMRPGLPLPVIAPADTGHVLVRVTGRTFTIGDYLHFWERVSAVTRPEVRDRTALESAVDRVALLPEILRVAKERGLDRDPALLAEVAEMREGYQLDHYYHDQIETRVKVTDDALRAYWKKDPAHYNDRASISSHVILVDRRSLADSLLTSLRNGAAFADLAKEFSNDANTGTKGGDAGTFYRGTQPNAGLEDAMFATPVGQLGGPEKTPQGWVIWRVDSSTPAVTRTFEEARTMVDRDYRIVEADRMLRAKLDKLRAEAHVKIYADRMTADIGKGGAWD